ncbi:MAG: hypothetical protein RL060_916 [Bacteroidota bacterium]|jgi:hypothetical protein
MKTYLSILLFLLIHLAQAQPLLPVEINNKWGFINAEGKVVIDAKYEMPIDFNDNGLAIAVSHQKYGIINQLGIEVIPPHYQELMWLSNTLLSYRKEALWGVINLKEQTIIPAQFLEIAIADNFIHAYASHHHSIFNLSGKNIIAPTNFIVKKLANYWLVENEQLKLGLFDLDGRELLPSICDSILPVHDSLLFFKTELGWQYKTNQQNIADVHWKSVKMLVGNLVCAEVLLGKHALFNTMTQDYITENDFSDFKVVDNIILGHKHHHLFAFDLKGKKYPFDDYEEIKPIGFGLFSVKKNHKFGVVNDKNVLILPLDLTQVLPFMYTVTIFQKDSLWGIISKKGDILAKALYAKIELTDGHARLYKHGEETAIRFNAEGDIDANFNALNTIHIGAKKKIHHSTHLKKVDPVYASNCFALFHDGEAVGSLVHRDMIKQAFTLFNTCTNAPIKSNVKLLDANLEEFTDHEVAACIIEGGSFGVLHKNGHVLTSIEVMENGKPVHQHITYVGSFVEGLARICVGGEVNFNLKTEVLSGLTYYFDVENVKGGSWGYIDSKGSIAIAPMYQKVENFSHQTAIVQRQSLWGIINLQNQVVMPIQYNAIQRMPNTNDSLLLVAEDKNEKGVLNSHGDIVVAINYDELKPIQEGVVSVKKGGKWGFMEVQSNKGSSMIYDEVHAFSDSLCAVKWQKKWGFVNHQFKEVITNKYESISNFSHNLAFVRENNHFEIVNKKGEVVSDLKLKEVFDYEHGVAIAKKNDGYGLIDTKGHWIVNPKFHKILPFNKHQTAIAHASPGKHVLINTKGEHITFHQFDSIDDFHEGLALVKLNGKYGYVDTLGNLIIEPKYEEAHAFSNGLAKVKLSKNEAQALADLAHAKKHQKYSFINPKGEIVIADLVYDHIHAFSNDMALVYLKNEKFFINKTGLPELDLKNKDLEIVSGFEEEKAVVKHKWTHREYYIDKDGDKLFGKTFEQCRPFKNGIAIVKEEGKFGLLAENGTLLVDFKYDDIKGFENGFSEVNLIRKYGVVDLSGKFILPPSAEKIEVINKHIFKIETSNSFKYMFKNGKWLWSF